MNWWLVANRLKHGMMTVRPAAPAKARTGGGMSMPDSGHGATRAPHPPLAVLTAASFVVLSGGLAISWIFGGLAGG